MIGPRETLEWLEHRAGVRRISSHPAPYFNRALELDDKGDAFVAAYGRKEIKGFVGFVDLVGFSARVVGLAPVKVGEYLKPFLCGIIDEVSGCGGLVDKTIGDEVMFVLPDMEEDGGTPARLMISHLVRGLHDLQRRLGASYPFRIGLSYGLQFVDRVEGKGYAECTIVGESVNLAKKLHGLLGDEPKDGISGGFGVLEREIDEKNFQGILELIAGFARPLAYRIVGGETELIGVSAARCAVLFPKVPPGQWQPGMKFD